MKRLQTYLAGDLVKATVMAAAALTLLLTILGLIEPMRKQGLAPAQVLAVFGFTLPVMLSLTLPVSSVFAATIVYGRFSQDNELLACRASGVATLTILKPGLLLGVGSTILALILCNFVAPFLASRADTAILRNIKGVVFNQLKNRRTLEKGRFILRADGVDLKAERLDGVVVVIRPDTDTINSFKRSAEKLEKRAAELDSGAARPRKGETVKKLRNQAALQRREAEAETHKLQILSARSAHITDFRATADGGAYFGIYLTRPVGGDTAEYKIGYLKNTLLEGGPVPNPSREKISWYSWGKLLNLLSDPTLHGSLRRELIRYRQRISAEIFVKELVAMIKQTGDYEALRSKDTTYILHATTAEHERPQASKQTSARVWLQGDPDATGPEQFVTVDVRPDEGLAWTVSAKNAIVSVGVSPVRGTSMITVRLMGPVEVRRSEDTTAPPYREEEWEVGEISLPKHIVEKEAAIDLADLCENPDRHTKNAQIIEAIRSLNEDRVPRLIKGVIAEMNLRVAYGASCFLMVAMGAALGLIFRGGQMVMAFTLTTVPSTVVILMVYMGNQMVRNPSVPMQYGLAAMWSGIILIGLASVFAYWHLARK